MSNLRSVAAPFRAYRFQRRVGRSVSAAATVPKVNRWQEEEVEGCGGHEATEDHDGHRMLDLMARTISAQDNWQQRQTRDYSSSTIQQICRCTCIVRVDGTERAS
jgi:hypothetical protein